MVSLEFKANKSELTFTFGCNEVLICITMTNLIIKYSKTLLFD